MSKETWLKEYYPVPAGSQEATATPAAAVKHSIRKWRGMRPAALQYHKVKVVTGCGEANGLYGLRAVTSRAFPFLTIDSGTCALCIFYHGDCPRCPLYAVRGCSCDSHDKFELAPYIRFSQGRNPEPMIHWLEAALEFVESGRKARGPARHRA